jgi:hypothetical protein
MKALRMVGFVAASACGLGAFGQNAPFSDQHGQRVVLVELFTSEGCSSCPPADALLRKLDGKRTADGLLIVGLGEHVTYWDSQAWQDRFSADVFTERQKAYGDRFRLDDVYTPQMVVNGQSQVNGSDGVAVARAIQAANASGVGLEISTARAAEGKVTLTYVLRGDVPPHAEVWAAVTDDQATSNVKGGENGGRLLEHVAVARSLTLVGAARAEKSTISVKEPKVLQGQEKTGRHVVVFVQEAGAGNILAVESHAL